MVSVVLLLVVILGAYLMVGGGATAYELTGLDRETARFQALSAFTGTGFTTRASHLVVNTPVRRRITSALIIVGYASTATVVATLVSSVGDSNLATLVNLGALAVLGVSTWLLLDRFGRRVVADPLRRWLAPRVTGDSVPHEELLLYKRGFGITRIEIPPNSLVIGRSLRQLDLRAVNLQVLAVEDLEVHPIPDPDWVFEVAQHVVLYGEVGRVQDVFAPPSEHPG